MSPLRFITFVVTVAFAAPAFPACKGAGCDRETPWRKMTAVTLRLADPDTLWLDTFRAEFDHARGDAAIELDLRRPEGEARGTVALVGSRVMLARGVPLERGREIDALDYPLLHIQLAMLVLGRALPEGPAALKEDRKIDRTDKVALKYATPGTSGELAAPWRTRGTVAKLPTGAVSFSLLVTAPPAGGAKGAEPVKIQLQGEMSMLGRAVFPDEASLAGWSAYSLGPRTEQKGKGAVVDFGANAEPREFKTIGEIRAFITERQRALPKIPGK